MNAALFGVGVVALVVVLTLAALNLAGFELGVVDEPTVADDEHLVEAIRHGETVDDDELARLLAAWRDESRP